MLNSTFDNKILAIESQSLTALFEDEFMEKQDTKFSYSAHGGVAIIPIHGVLTKRTELFAPLMGSVSYEEIKDAFIGALQNEQVSNILFDIDSPGGEIGGLFDLVDLIYQSRGIKPIYAIANDSAFSAAYAIASAADKVFVTRTGGVGSIGVIATHADISEADKQEGVKITTIYAGDKKNDLSPHYPLSEGAANDLQEEVNRLYEIFVATVARNRKTEQSEIKATQAAAYFADNAIKIGLVDGVASLEEVLNNFVFGGEMNEDLEKYKAEVLEISRLCKLANAEGRISSFIEAGNTAEEVKAALLEAQAQKESKEIMSAVYKKEEIAENPVLKAAKERVRRG